MDEIPRARARRFFEPLLAGDPSGRDWLGALLRAAPRGEERFGALLDEPGSLHANLTVPGLEGRRPCFEYPVAPPPELVAWFIEHPERLTWPVEAELSPEVGALRRALVCDEPRGARARAQQRARELAPVRSAFAREWWRFEETFAPDCLLMTDRLVLVVVAAGRELEPVSDWYPRRTVLHRGLEAAERLAGQRRWGALVVSQAPVEAQLWESLPEAVPHRDGAGRAGLAGGYLGHLVWEEARDAVAGTATQR